MRWDIKNGSGWNDHQTAKRLKLIAAELPQKLPQPPEGYLVLVAPVNMVKPMGLRCALVRVSPREGDVGGSFGDNPSQWAAAYFGVYGEVVRKCFEDCQDEDSTDYFIRKMTEAIEEIEHRVAAGQSA